MNQADGKGRARSKSRPSRQIAVMVDLKAVGYLRQLQRRSHRRMLNILNAGNILDHRINDAMLVLKKRWEPSTSDVAIFIYCCRQHRASVLAEPSWIIGAAPEK